MSGNLSSRHTIRLRNFDYSSANWYYVTICTHNRECLFGDIVNPVCVGATRGSPAYMKLNNYGQCILHTWHSLPNHHPVALDSFQIMPNHVHGVMVINRTGGSRPAPTLATIIGMFKSECTKQIRQIFNNPNIIIWQRNYYEHIIRDEGELTHIRKYISDNPINWSIDKLFVSPV